MKTTWIFILFLASLPFSCIAQDYTVNKNAHSHNDYSRSVPFYVAYGNRFASIEIDVFLVDNELYVAHDSSKIDKRRTIERLYIQPLLNQIELNDGKVYPGGGSLQFLIDLKTESEPTLSCLESKLKPIRHYFDTENNTNAVRLVISGKSPSPDKFKNFDRIFYFDGQPEKKYNKEQMDRIAFFSTPLSKFSRWNGQGRLPKEEYRAISAFVDSIHQLGKKVRIWGNPNTEALWRSFIEMGVDYLNTDLPNDMAAFLKQGEKKHKKHYVQRRGKHRKEE